VYVLPFDGEISFSHSTMPLRSSELTRTSVASGNMFYKLYTCMHDCYSHLLYLIIIHNLICRHIGSFVTECSHLPTNVADISLNADIGSDGLPIKAAAIDYLWGRLVVDYLVE